MSLYACVRWVTFFLVAVLVSNVSSQLQANCGATSNRPWLLKLNDGEAFRFKAYASELYHHAQMDPFSPCRIPICKAPSDQQPRLPIDPILAFSSFKFISVSVVVSQCGTNELSHLVPVLALADREGVPLVIDRPPIAG